MDLWWAICAIAWLLYISTHTAEYLWSCCVHNCYDGQNGVMEEAVGGCLAWPRLMRTGGCLSLVRFLALTEILCTTISSLLLLPKRLVRLNV